MRKVGNVASNQIYNPRSKRPPVPIDADEADSAMERLIRQKYIHNVSTESRKPRSPGSDEGTPPPLPPKNSSKFGFRSASSIFPLSYRTKKGQRTASISGGGAVVSPILANKPSKMLGSTVDYDSAEDTNRKLAKLREMGFQDSQRNAIVLKGVNGNMDRAIEALVRLGEGRSRSPGPSLPPREPVLRSVKSMTPLTSSWSSTGLGLSLDAPQTSNIDRCNTSSTVSTNPFDMMPVTQPQTAQSTGSLHHKNPYSGTNNPFGLSAQQGDFVSQSFQGLNLCTSQPTLSPQNLAGMMAQTPSPPMQQQQQQQRQQQQWYMSPSTPASPQHFQSLPYTLQPMQTGHNPFLSQSFSPTMMSQNMMVNTATGGAVNNPYARSPTMRIGSPTLGQIPEQAPSYFAQSPLISTSPQPLPTSANPFFTNMSQQQPPKPQPQQVQSDTSHFGQQAYVTEQLCNPRPRHDKASILALYNQPGTSFPRVAAAEPNLATFTQSIPENQAAYAQSTEMHVAKQQPRSILQPLPGGTNPFMKQKILTQGDSCAPNGNFSRDSMNLGMDMAWTNGRHSPDAFASLSARHT